MSLKGGSKTVVSPYLLVFWELEERYSVVKREKLEDDGQITIPDYFLKGTCVFVKWNSESYMAKIINAGEKSDLNQELKTYRKEARELKKSLNLEKEIDGHFSQENSAVSQTFDNENEENEASKSTSTKRKRTTKSGSVKKLRAESNSSQIQNVLTELDPNIMLQREIESQSTSFSNAAFLTMSNSRDIDYWIKQCDNEREKTEGFKILYEKEKDRADTYKNKVKTLRQRNKKLKEETNNPEYVDLGSGVNISREQLDTIKTVSCDPSKFARNLFRLVFTTEEMNGKSLFGQKCRANKDALPLPSVDAIKRNAVILTTLKEFSTLDRFGKPSKGDPVKRVVHQTLGALLREKTSEQRRQYQNNNIENVNIN